jgi:hypothetical protein
VCAPRPPRSVFPDSPLNYLTSLTSIMTSLGPPEFIPGSVSSVYSIRDAIESCQCLQFGDPFDESLWLMVHRPLYLIDRRSQVMYSTSRVASSSYAGTAPRGDDEARRADEGDDEEEVETPQPGRRTPQEGFVSNLNWDEDDEPMTSAAYHRLVQHAVYTSSENRRDVQQAQAAAATISRSHAWRVPVDERSPLLVRARGGGGDGGDGVPEAEAEGDGDAEAALQPTGPPTLSPNSVAAVKSAVVSGQSTFSQTVRDFSFRERELTFVGLAFQWHRAVAWDRHAFGASRVLV